jgi:acetyl esterase
MKEKPMPVLTRSYNPTATYRVESFDRVYRTDRHGDWPVRVYQPQGTGPFPVLVDVHGGAWTRGTYLNNEAIDYALAQTGMLVCALEFRQSPQDPYPAQVQDVNYGTRWVKAHAKELNGDPDNVGGLGTSSGGHSLMLSVLRYDDPLYASEPVPGGENRTAALRYAITGWPVLDSHARYLYAKAAGEARLIEPSEAYFSDEEAMKEGSPQHSVDRGDFRELPPMLILQGTKDDNVPLEISEHFVAAYRAKGGDVERVLFPDMPHAFAQKPGPETDRAIGLMKEFLAKHV